VKNNISFLIVSIRDEKLVTVYVLVLLSTIQLLVVMDLRVVVDLHRWYGRRRAA
jgi:hypothetical protein